MVLVLIAQVCLLSHEAGYAVNGDSDSCRRCWLADHQANALTTPGLMVSGGAFSAPIIEIQTIRVSFLLSLFGRAPF